MPALQDLKQLRALIGGVGYYRCFYEICLMRLRPINSLLRKHTCHGQNHDPSRASGSAHFWSSRIKSPSSTAPDRSSHQRMHRQFRRRPKTRTAGRLGALIAYFSRATLGAERHWNSTRFRSWQHLLGNQTPSTLPLGTKFRPYFYHKGLLIGSIGKVGDDNARVQR